MALTASSWNAVPQPHGINYLAKPMLVGWGRVEEYWTMMPSTPDRATTLNYWPSVGPSGLQDHTYRPWWPDKETGLITVDMKVAMFHIEAEGSPDSHRYMPWLEPFFFFPVQSTLHGRFLIGITGFNLWHVISAELHVRLMGRDVSSHLSVMIMSLLPSCVSHPCGA